MGVLVTFILFCTFSVLRCPNFIVVRHFKDYARRKVSKFCYSELFLNSKSVVGVSYYIFKPIYINTL